MKALKNNDGILLGAFEEGQINIGDNISGLIVQESNIIDINEKTIDLLKLNKYVDSEWVDGRSLGKYKSDVNDKIDITVTQRILAGFEYDSKIFSMSTNAQSNWLGLSTASEDKFPQPINTKDDSDKIDLAYADRDAFYSAAYDHKKLHLDWGTAKKALVRGATTYDELKDIEDNLND